MNKNTKSEVNNKPVKEQDEEFRHVVRIINADLDGNKKIINSLRSIKGIGFMFANAICKVSGIEPNKKTGYLSNKELSKIKLVLEDPSDFNIPNWMFNRKRELQTNKDIHILGVDLDIKTGDDIRRMKMIRSYRGVRHMFHLPVRGQRTRSNFRKNKGRVVGVLKRAAKAAKGKSSAKR